MPSPRIRIVLQSLTLAAGALLIAGIACEQYGRRQDRNRLPQIGKSIDIGGRSLNILCSGTGTPAVIFESGGDAPGLSWTPIQTEVAKFTQACWYDRAGIGWSDPGPFPRTSAAIANDLHALLQRANVPPPYILAGASFGGLNSRVYAALFPREVAGLVLIDSAHEDESRRAPRFYLARTAPRFFWRPLDLLLRAASFVGLLRLTAPSPTQSAHPPQATPANTSEEALEKTVAALRNQPKSIVNNISTGIVLPESYAEARAIRSLGDCPLIVLTAGQPFDYRDPELNRQAAAYQQVWIHEMQAALSRLSTRGRQIVLQNSNHASIPNDAIVAAVRDLVTQARVHATEPHVSEPLTSEPHTSEY
jgi:pimeloyl-ACP methyl ester carboxylesterase